MEEFDLFLKCLKDMNDPQSVNDANEKLNALMIENTALYLTFASQVILNFCEKKEDQEVLESENDVIVSLGAIKSSCIPKRSTQIQDIRDCWNSNDPITNEMRSLVLKSVLSSISNQSIPIRKVAYAVLAAVIQIDKKNSNDIIRTVLTKIPPADPLNFGSILLFLEIFYLKAIPLEINFQFIDKDLYMMLLDNIFNVLSNLETVTQQMKGDTSICLKKLIEYGGDDLFEKEMVDKILEMVRFVFQNTEDLSPELYKELHFVMLELIKSLYIHANVFYEKIYEITEVGFQSENVNFKIISYDFWKQLCKFEMDIEIDKDKNYSRNYWEELINNGIQLIAIIDPNEKYLLSEDEDQSNEYICKALSQIFEKIMRTADFSVYFDKLKELIDEFLSADESNNSDTYIKQNYTGVILMRSLVFDHTNDEVFMYIGQNIPYIASFAKVEVDFLSEASNQLLKELLDKYKRYREILANPDNIQSIFKVIQVCSRFPIPIAKRTIDLIDTFINRMKSELFDDFYFDNLFEIFVEKFSDKEFMQSNGIYHLQIAFAALINKDGRYSNVKLFNILKNSLQLIKTPLFSTNYGFVMPIALTNPEEVPEDKSEYPEDSVIFFSKDRYFLLAVITLIFRKFSEMKNDLEDPIKDFLETIFHFLQNQSSFLFYECLSASSDIVEIIKLDFLPYVPDYVSILKDGLHSQDPNLVGASSYCLGNLCKNLGEPVGEHVREVIFGMFELMTSFDEYQQMDVIDNFFTSFADIVLSLKVYIVNEMDFVISLFNFGLTMINFRVNLEDINEYEFAEKLYTSLCLLFKAIIEILPPDVYSDATFINVLKKKLFPIFAKIESLHTQNLDLILATVKFLGTLAKPKETSLYCSEFHKKPIVLLCKWFNYRCCAIYSDEQSKEIADTFRLVNTK